MSKPFSLDFTDIVKALVVVALGAVLGGLQQMLTAHGLDFASYDWSLILNLAISAGGAYITKNFFSDSNGAVLTPFGQIGGRK